jgi:hypothetical protein
MKMVQKVFMCARRKKKDKLQFRKQKYEIRETETKQVLAETNA